MSGRTDGRKGERSDGGRTNGRWTDGRWTNGRTGGRIDRFLDVSCVYVFVCVCVYMFVSARLRSSIRNRTFEFKLYNFTFLL